MIVEVIQRYHPEWEPPKDNGRLWVACLCPFHADEDPSGAVNYRDDLFNCLACGVKGSPINLIHMIEEVHYREAVRIAETISAGGDGAVPPKLAPIRRTWLFDSEGIGFPVLDIRDTRPVPTGIRRRPFTGA